MEKATAIKNFSFKRSRIKRITVSQGIKKGETILSVSLVAIIILMSLAYIFQISSVATNGYEVNKYESRFADLKKENQRKTIEIADLKAMHNLENSNDRFVAVEYSNVSYITSSSSVVAIGR